jgi:hypothetical protein
MASVGELFKFLGSNDIFQGFCKESEKTNQQIIDDVFQNEELIAKLRSIVQDDNIIKSKMDILIGQKRKTQNKKPEQKTNGQTDKQEGFNEFKYVPINQSKVIYLEVRNVEAQKLENVEKIAYIEQVDHRIRLVTNEFEMYY